MRLRPHAKLGHAADLENGLETTEATRGAWPLLVACLLHVALFAFFGARSADAAVVELAPIDVTLEEQPQRTDALRAHEEIAEAKVVDPASASRRLPTTSEPSDSNVAPVGSAMPTAPQDVLHTQDGDAPWTFRTTRGGIDLGLGDKTGNLARQMLARGDLEMPKPPPPPPPAPPPPPVSPGVKMIQELDAMDVERGFGRGGPVVQAIERVVRDAVPPEGSATFEVAIEKTGKISVRVLEAALNRAEWEKLSDAIIALVKTKHVRFPERALGLRIAVRVAASDHTGGGGDKSSIGSGVAPSFGNPSGRDDAAMQQGNLPHFAPSMGGFSPGGGARDTRIVSAHEVYEQRM